MTLYEILEVSEKASNEIIEKAYKTLAKKYHPDLQPDQAQKAKASEKMKKINEAYSTLSDDAKRKEYDEKLEAERKRLEYLKQQKMQEQYKSNSNSNPFTNQTYAGSQSAENANYQNSTSATDWRNILSHLEDDEKSKIAKKIQRDAKKEYESMYRDYFRSMGYRRRHKITFRGVCSLIITICVIIIVVWLLLLIPPIRDRVIEIYRTNTVFKIFVDLIYAILSGTLKAIKSLLKVKI